MKKNKKKILLMIGSDLRNNFICAEIMKKYFVSGIIFQKRLNKFNSIPKQFSQDEKKLYIKHFSEREISEKKFFKKVKINFDNIEHINVKEKDINSISVQSFIKKIKPNIVIVYGVGFLKKNILKIIPKNSINIHTGITPRFKGDACNFWAFYFLEPNNAGATIHFLSSKVDSGPIITQVKPRLNFGDNMHDITNKSLKIVAKKINKLIGILEKKNINGILKQGGKTFYASNFKPYHLKTVYHYYNNKIVDLYLKKKITGKSQKLVKLI